MVRFVHTADWQLGLRRHFLDPDAQARFTDARLDAVRRIGELAEREGCAFVTVAGDVFEDNHVERRVVWRALEAMESIPVPVYLLPGNHDPLNAGSIYRSGDFSTHAPANVTVLDTWEPVPAGDGVEILAAPWSSKRPLEDLCAAVIDGASDPDPGTTRILVAHGIVDTLSPDPMNPAQIAVEALDRALGDGRVQFVGLGDRHSTTEVGASGRVWYAGAPEATGFDESDPGNALVVDLHGGRCEVEAHRIGSWRFIDEGFALDGDEDVDIVRDWLARVPDPKRAIVRVSFVGTLSLRGRAALDRILDDASEVFGALQTWERHTDLAVLADDADVTDLGLAGFARDAVDALSGRVAEDPGDEAAGDALRLLHRLAGAGG